MKLSVIVCAKNSESTIKECLESVRNNNPSEIILIHGKSSDNTLKIARKYVDSVYSDKGKGLSYARQLGAKKAKESLISYTDADTVVPKNCYKSLIREMRENSWVSIHAQIVSPKNHNYLEWAEDVHFRVLFNNFGRRHRIGTIVTVWEKSKVLSFGFDSFMNRTSEDQDLCVRLVNAGFSLGVGSVEAFHRHRTNFRSFVKQKFQYGWGNARMAWKHKSPKFLVNWLLSVPYGFYRVSGKFGLFTGFKMLPYYFLNAFCVGFGVFYEFFKLVLGV
ncbi:MAG: glycosyltransferase [Nanoarchaeota archaeon]|nr:glycosyltransferase [Nanoarchaeota archaeon]